MHSVQTIAPADHNLPPQATPFVGRTQELAEIAQRLADPTCRLLTLVGTGGIGKTRLALQAAADQRDHFEDGVCFVNLVSVHSPGLLASTLAAALNISLYGPDEPRLQINRYLCDRQMLLVLDNFESVLDEAEPLVDLLTQAPRLKLMVTSRERLSVQEEWVLPIEGMPYPTESALNEIEQFGAVRLFMQSARRVQPTFTLADHSQAVITICRQVEGMPLALELAASWLRLLPADQIAAQLERNLDFLTTPLRNVPARHRSLRAVFDGSWKLLHADEQSVLIRLSIFRGGFDLAAAQYIAGASLLVLAALIDKSLLRAHTSGRYDLHELLRQYASEKLAESGEVASTSRRHLAFYLDLAERAEADIYGPEQIPWFDRLEAEQGNLHAALAWAMEAHEAHTGLRLAAALGWFWQLRVHLREGSQWFERLLDADDANRKESAAVRAKALHRASEIETQLNNSTRAQMLAETSLALAQSINHTWNMAWALAAIGIWGKHGRMQTQPFEDALALFRALNDGWGISHCLRRLSLFLELAGDFPRAAELAEESLALAQAAQDKSAMAWSLYALGFAHRQLDNAQDRAVLLFQESLPYFRDIRDVSGLSMALDLVGAMLFIRGDVAQAHEYFEENLRLTLERTWVPALTNTNSLAGFIVLIGQQDEIDKAATLLAALEDHFDAVQSNSATYLLAPQLAEIRSRCCDSQFVADWAHGRTMTLEQAAAFALQSVASHSSFHPPDTKQSLLEPLSERELEIVRLLAAGLSNAQIAQKLFLAVGTVKVHTRNLYGKLGVNSRTQAIAQAHQLNLM